MADPWDSAPIVEEAPRAGLAKPGRQPAAAAAPWDSAPVITPSSALPNVDPKQAAGLAPRTGAAAIPTAEEVRTGAYTPPVAPPAMPEPTIKDKVIGAAEAGLELMANLIAMPAGMLGGIAAGEGQQAMAGPTMQGAVGLVRRVMERSPISGPGILTLRAMGGGTGEGMSPKGREYTEGIGGAMANLPPVMGVHGTLAGPAAAGASGMGLRRNAQLAAEPATGLVRKVVDTVERVLPKEKAPGAEAPAGSVGAAAVDMPTQRRERAAALGVNLTKGDAERSFEQQRFEKETAKNPELGKPLRERKAEQRRAILDRFDEWVDETGAGDLEANALGKGVTDPIYDKALKAKQEVRAKYDAADDAGETAELVNYTPIRAYIEDQTPTTREKLAPILKMTEEQLAKNDPEGSGQVSIKALNDVRKAIRANTEFGTPNSVQGGEIIKLIDTATENAGGDLYKAARKAHAEYAAEFKNQGVIRDLMTLKKGTTDRKVALAQVFDRSVLKATIDDVRAVKRTLTTAGEGGVQAWNDLRGKTIEWIKGEATKSAVRDERGNPVISADKMMKAVERLDKDGRLEELFGKQGAQQLRDVADIAKDVWTSPPDAVNTSNTASVFLGALDTFATYMLSGGTVPLPAFMLVKKGLQNLKDRKLKAKVRYALGPGDEVTPSPVRAFEPGKEPPPPTGPGNRGGPTPPPTPPAPAGAASPQATLPGVEPPIASRETSRGTKRERDLVSLRDQATDPQVLKDLDIEIAAERRRTADAARAVEYRKLAEATSDADIKAKFTEKAEKLAPTPPKAAEPKPEPIPVGDATELEVQDASVDMVKATAEAEAAWRREHRVGDLDAERMKTAWQAMEYDAPAVQRAAQQFDNSPRAFDREVQRIIEEGKARETQVNQDPGRGPGVGRPAEAAGGQAGPGPQRPGPDGNAKAGAQRSAPDDEGGQAAALRKPETESQTPQSSVAKAIEYLEQHPDVPPAVREGILQRYREAERALPIYDKALRAAGAALGDKLGEVIVAPIKVPSRATEKILVDYQGDTRRIKDLVRGTIVLKDISAAKDVIASLRKEFGNLLDVRDALREGSDPVSPDGYRDMKMTVMVDGHLAEVQVSVPEMVAAKNEAHPLYERTAAISRKADNEGRDLTPAEAAEKRALEDRQAAIYGSAWEAATSRLNSGSSTRRPLRSNEASANLRSGSESQARSAYSDDRVTGTPSTSKNSVPAGNDRGSGIAAPPAGILDANAAGRQTIATTERGVEIPVRYRLVDVGQLITSHDDTLRLNPAFPQDLQPRDRTRMSSEAQITKISNDIKPEFLADSPKASDGAPIVGSDAVVESGNARTIALRRAYANGKADHYREWLRANAGRFGLSPADIDSVKQPMLVREGLGKYDRAEFARQANESPVSSMAETEVAQADAKKLPDLEGLATNDDGSINASQSAEFIRQFMRYVASPNEHNQLMTGDGRLSQRGAARIRNAVFSKAYGDSDIVSMLTEATDGNVRNLLAGMLRAAPDVARVRTLLEAGARAGRDFVPDLVDAVRRFGTAREASQKVEQYLAQGSMFGGEAPPAVADLMRSLEKDSRAPTRIADMIRGLVAEIDKGGDPRQPSMF